MDESSPTEISAENVTRRDKGIYNAPESFRIEYRYANGTRVVMSSTTNEKNNGIRFVGTKGTIFTENERLETDPPSLRSVRPKDGEVKLFESKNHYRNFIDAVLTRGRTAAPAPIAQRAATMCHLGAISAALGRPVKYDPAAENSFTKPYSEETSKMIDQEVRKLIEVAYEKTKALLREKRAQVEKLAEELLVKEVLFQSDVEKLIGKRPFREQKTLDVDDDNGSEHHEKGAISEGVPPYDSNITNHPATQQ